MVFILLFGTQIGSKQANLFVSYKKGKTFLKSNNFGTFLSHFYIFFALFDINRNNYLFWIDFLDLNQIIYSFWFVGIRHYSTYYGKSCQIICFDSFRLDSFYESNHLFFDSFQFVLGYKRYRFKSVTNWITKALFAQAYTSRELPQELEIPQELEM